MLRTGDMKGLEATLAERPDVVRHLTARLWDLDPAVRSRAAVLLGKVPAHHPELGLELLRRFAWALNDESVTNAVDVIPAVVEIAVQAPEMGRPFIGRLVAALEDPNAALRQEAARGLRSLRRRRPELVEPYQCDIERRIGLEPSAGEAEDGSLENRPEEEPVWNNN